MMLTGRQVDADEAYWIGLVDRFAEPGETARAGAWQLAHELAEASTPAQLAVVRTVDAAYDRPIHDGLRYEVEQVQELFERGEAMEGLRAFIDKRDPEFV
jgi:enoyl-CoA hydratase/carnithine racemase